MAIELATAYLSIVPETSKIAPAVKKALGEVDGKTAQASGKKTGKSMAGAIGGALTKGLKWTAAGAAAGLGVALTKGLTRLVALDNATAKLSGLGHSAKNVDAIMKDALASVKGTAFGMDEAATTAAGAVAAGVKPGKDLERTLKLVADAATIGGSSMSEMGSIFNKVATSNKVQGDVINQLNERGIPIVQLMAKELGKTAEETVALASAGEIGFDTFRDAMEKGLGGAALKSGETFMGALKNTWAAVGRIGANLLSGVFPKLAGGLGTLTAGLGVLEDKATVVGEALGGFVDRAMDGFKGLSELVKGGEFIPDLSSLGTAAREVFDYLRGVDLGPLVRGLTPMGTALLAMLPVIKPLVPLFRDLAVQVFGALEAILPELGAAFETLGQTVGKLALVVLPPLLSLITGLVGVLPPLVGWIADNASWLTKLGIAVGAVVLAWKGYQLVTAAVKAVQLGLAAASYGVAGATYATGAALKVYNALMGAARIRTIATTVAMKAAAFATKAWTVVTKAAAIGQRLLNLAMSANPIGLIVTAIGLLVTGILYLWNTNEGFRNFVIGAWEAIKAAFFTVVDWIRSNVVPVFQAMWAGIKTYMSALIGTVTGAWDAVTGAFKAAWDWVSGVFTGLWGGLVDIFGGPFNTIRNIVSVFVAFQIYAFTKAWNWVKGTFSKLWNGIVGIFTKPINTVRAFIVKYMFYYRKTINDLWLWVKGVFSKAWAGWVNIMTGPINKVRDFLTAAIQGYRTIITTVWTWVRTTFNRWWTGVQAIFSGPIARARQAIADLIGRVRATIQTVWTWVRDTFARSWSRFRDTLVAPVKLAKEGISRALDSVKRAFTATKDAVAKSWDTIKKAMSTPVKWVADNVVNPLIRAFNKVADAVGMSGSKLSEWKFKGFASGGWTGPGSTLQPAGVVHADEFVIRKAARRRFEAQNPGVLDHLNRTGEMPGYAKGGRVFAPVPGRANQHSRGQYPWATFAGDFPVPMGTPIHAWKDGIVAAVRRLTTSYGKHVRINHDDGTSSLYAHMSKILVSLGQRVLGGTTIGRVGSTGNSTGPHLHFESMGGPYRGGKKGLGKTLTDLFGGFTNPLSWLKDLITSPLKLLSKAPGGMWGDIIAGLPRKMADGMTSFKFDDGGWLQPGYTLAYNATGSPEPVLTKSQWSAVREGGGSGMTFGDVYGLSPEDVAAEIMKQRSRRAALRPVLA